MLQKQNNNNKETGTLAFGARQNISGFFDLLFKIAIREKIDIGQYEDSRDTNNSNKTK